MISLKYSELIEYVQCYNKENELEYSKDLIQLYHFNHNVGIQILTNIQETHIAQRECALKQKSLMQSKNNSESFFFEECDDENYTSSTSENEEEDEINEDEECTYNIDLENENIIQELSQNYDLFTNKKIEKALNSNLIQGLNSNLQNPYYKRLNDNIIHSNINNNMKSTFKNWNEKFLMSNENFENNKMINEKMPNLITLKEAITSINNQYNEAIQEIETQQIPEFVHPNKLAAIKTLSEEQKPIFLFFAYYLLLNFKKTIHELNNDHYAMKDIEDIYKDNKMNLPKICLLGGESGSGKTHVLKTLYEFAISWNMPNAVALTSTLGIAAITLNGTTWQHFLKWYKNKKFTKKKNQNFTVETKYEELLILAIDECSLLSCSGFKTVVYQLERLKNICEELFKYVIILLCGDFCQNFPISGVSLINAYNVKSSMKENAIEGAAKFTENLTHAFFIHEVKRQEKGPLLDIFRNMRYNKVTSNDAKYINENTLINEKRSCPNLLTQPYAPIIVYNHYQRYKIQQIILKNMVNNNIPLYCIEAKLTSSQDIGLDNEYKELLYRLHEKITGFNCTRLVIFKGMPVLCTENTMKLYGKDKYIHTTQFGISNGTRAIVDRFIFDKQPKYKHKNVIIYGSKFRVLVPNIFPKAIIIKLISEEQQNKLKQLDLDNLAENEFPITMQRKTISFITKQGQKINFNMKQFPLLPAIAITGHKYEGITVKDAYVIGSDGPKEWLYTTYTRASEIENIYSFLTWDEKTIKKLNKINYTLNQFIQQIDNKIASTNKELKHLLN